MNFKRIMTAIVGLPFVILLIIFGNSYIIDIALAIIAVIALYEYSNCIKKEAKFISLIGYFSAIFIAFTHIIPDTFLNIIFTLSVPILIFLLFLCVVISNMKITFKDAVFTLFGILYIVGFLEFLSFLYGSTGEISGKYLIWYVLFSAWGCDTFAYLFGKNFGKHKFSRVSPNKTIEGCVGGVFGAILFSILGTFIINNYCGIEIEYAKIIILSSILSIIGQIGDFSASTIKRCFDVKDFGELFPGHGGMIDRIDSIIFIAPFAYFLLTMFL